MHLVLASASPRRSELLRLIGINPVCHPVDIDETQLHAEPAESYCRRMSIEKVAAWLSLSSDKNPVLGADTIVVNDGICLGKPLDEKHATEMLLSLSGKVHKVISSVTVSYLGQQETMLSQTDVHFSQIDLAWIKAYVNSGEPMDKAGAYGIQGAASMWIEQIKGSHSSVMGLPLFEVRQMLSKLGIIKDLTGQ